MASRKATSLNPLCPHVANRRKAGFECDACIACPDQGFARHGNRETRIAEVGIERDVRVRVNQSGQHGGVRQIDDLRSGGDLRVGANARDLIALDHDGLVGKRLAGFHVKQMPRVNDDRLRRRRSLLRPAHVDAKERKDTRIQVTAELHSIPQ